MPNETQCLAQNIYHEARGEPFRGKLAVARVTLNRVNSGTFPNTICGVVYQKGQFSWTSKRYKIRDQHAWGQAVFIANLVTESPEILGHFPALYFHNKTVKPNWKRKKLATIGQHTFYM